MDCPACGNRNRQGAKFCDSCGATLEPAHAPQAAATNGAGSDGAPGEQLPESFGAGRYRVERFLGQGGRKSVYLAHDAEDDRQVAVAAFSSEGIDEAVLARARRESEAMRQLGGHPHIVTVYDTGEDDGNPYIVSQYMPGGDVEALLAAEGGRLPLERALEIADDVCAALEHAHSRGIVHRDLKPANVWLTEDGTAKLGDFGLATTGGRTREQVEGILVGTVAYLPPEQAIGRASDARSDLYSLGALLYQMLTGQPPFPGDDALAIIGQHLNATPLPPSTHNPETPPAIDAVVLRLLEKSPDDRPRSAADARQALIAAAAAEPEPEPDEEATENPLDRLAGGVFVGREREVDEMRAALDDALTGRGSLMTLVGEPGIGKTRTAEELATYARVRGAKVYWGRCREGEGAPAYWPWVQVIRSYVAEADPVALAWEMGATAAEIGQIVPEVAERLGGAPEPAGLDAEEARFRLFDSITRFLTGAAKSRPLVLILDDLHWADEPSLLLLEFLAQELGDSGLLVLGTYRDVELGRHHPLAKVLGELAGLQGSRRITLRGLDTDDVARYIEMTAGVEPPPQLAEGVHEQTEGNPFFVSEVVRLLASEGRLDAGAAAGASELSIPQGVREVVGRRLDRLSDDTNRGLRVAAAIGRSFEVDVLARVVDRPREEILEKMEEAIGAQVLRSVGADRYGFSHALVRETLYEEIPTAQRVRLHHRIAEALEDAYAADPEPHVAELAHHFLESAQAGSTGKAVDYATRAAARMAEQFAHEEAADYYQRAVEVLDLGGDGDAASRCELLLELGEAQTRAGRFEPARESLRAAAELARGLEDGSSLGRAALGISATSVVGAADQQLVALLEEALEAVGENDCSLGAMLLSALSQEMYWVDPQGAARTLNRQAVEMARRVGDPRVLATTLTRQQFVLVAQPDSVNERLEAAAELIELAERAQDKELALRGHVYRLNNLLELGDIDGVDRELEIYTRLATELRQPRHLWHVPAIGAMRAIMEGRFDDALELSAEARAGGERASEPLSAQFSAIQTALIFRHTDRLGEILPSIQELAKAYPGIPVWRLALADIYSEVDRLDEARAEFERFVANDYADLPVDAQWFAGIALLADVCALLGDAERAPRLYELLLPYDGHAVVAGRAAACYGPVARYLGRLAMTMSRTDDAIRHFTDAIDLATRMGDRPFRAESRFHFCCALLARDGTGDRERALEQLGTVLDAAQELGMKGLVEDALAHRLEAQGLAGVDVTTSIDSVVSAVESERPDLRSYAAADGTVTIVFSDIENSTVMTERLGDERWLEVLREHNSIFRKHVQANGGVEVKNQGDGFMLVFPSARGGLDAAIAVQREFAARNGDSPASEQVRVRMGLHTGEVIAEEGDFFGKNVILAARIAAKADGEEILVSSKLREQADGDGELAFDDGRELELKGLAGTHQVFRAEWDAQAAPA